MTNDRPLKPVSASPAQNAALPVETVAAKTPSSGKMVFDLGDMAFIDWLGVIDKQSGKAPATDSLPGQLQIKIQAQATSIYGRIEQETLKLLETSASQEQPQDSTSSESFASSEGSATSKSKSSLQELQDIAQLQRALAPADATLLQALAMQAAHQLSQPFAAQHTIRLESLLNQSGNDISYQGIQFSPKLTELLQKARRSGAPIRVEVDDQTSVILRIVKGRVSAEFVSSDEAAAYYLKHQLSALKSKLQAQQLPVDDLQFRYRGDNSSDQGKHDKNAASNQQER